MGVGRDNATEEGARDVEYCEGAGEGTAVTPAGDGSGVGANEEEPAAAGDLLGVGVGRDSATEEGARDVEYCEGAGEGAAVTPAGDGSGVGGHV